MMNDRYDHPEHLWEKGWSGHEKAQLRRMSRLSFEEKIKWMEEAQKMIQDMERQKPMPPHPRRS